MGNIMVNKKILYGFFALFTLQQAPIQADTRDVAYGAAAGIGFALMLDNVMIPWLSGTWEKERKEKEAHDAQEQRRITIEQAQQLITRICTRYYDELNAQKDLSKKQLFDIITGRYGNHEFRFLKYDQDLTQTLCSLENIDCTVLPAQDQQKVLSLVQQLRFVEKQKNLLLSQEIIYDQQRNRELERSQMEFNAKLNNHREIGHLIEEMKKIVREQANNRSWTEEKLNTIANRIREEAQRLREMMHDEVRRNEQRWERFERQWQGLVGQQPPAYHH